MDPMENDAKRDVHIFWDSETASLGSNTSGFEAVTAIIGIANTFGDVSKFKVYLDPDGPYALSSATRSDIHACGVTLVYACGEGRQGAVGKMVLADSFSLALYEPSVVLLFVTADPDLLYGLALLKATGAQINIVSPPAAHRTVLHHASTISHLLERNCAPDLFGHAQAQCQCDPHCPHQYKDPGKLQAHSVQHTVQSGSRSSRSSRGRHSRSRHRDADFKVDVSDLQPDVVQRVRRSTSPRTPSVDRTSQASRSSYSRGARELSPSRSPISQRSAYVLISRSPSPIRDYNVAQPLPVARPVAENRGPPTMGQELRTTAMYTFDKAKEPIPAFQPASTLTSTSQSQAERPTSAPIPILGISPSGAHPMQKPAITVLPTQEPGPLTRAATSAQTFNNVRSSTLPPVLPSIATGTGVPVRPLVSPNSNLKPNAAPFTPHGNTWNVHLASTAAAIAKPNLGLHSEPTPESRRSKDAPPRFQLLVTVLKKHCEQGKTSVPRNDMYRFLREEDKNFLVTCGLQQVQQPIASYLKDASSAGIITCM
ncbi:hypothetical protein BKA70DRAFT_1248703 [Coprinopsis sp. MPI-PUGE-AT-0042]|nr:hypothetical protein BKA70DRAFT_1248703 [Coprinopsis sp. MPI-PUGE-AT-0042]